MFFRRIFAAGLAAIAVPILLTLICVVPVAFWAPVFFSNTLISVQLSLFLLGVTPFATFVAFAMVRSFFLNERSHVRAVGKHNALWVVSAYTQGRFVTDPVVVLRESASAGQVPMFDPEYWSSLSTIYAEFVLRVADVVESRNMLLGAWITSWAVFWVIVFKFGFRLLKWALLGAFVGAYTALLCPAEAIADLTNIALTTLYFLTPPGWAHMRVRLEWARLWVIALLLDVALLISALNHDMSVHYSEKLAGRRRKIGAVFRQKIMRTVTFITAVRLPAFVRNRFRSAVTAEHLAAGRQIMIELGWPVNVDIVSEPPGEVPAEAGRQWAAWKVADTSYATGIRQMKLDINDSLKELAAIAPAFYRTEEYRSIENELQSTSRYFQDKRVDFSVDIFNDVWDIVKPIFAGSRLTKFGDIIYLWEKKYALGFWMTDEQGRRKMSRRSYIAKVGMPAFRELWARTFMRASEIMPVAHISVKDEALSPRKRLADVVRTITGSPITHYIGSTVFSHWPNHNFKYQDTPIKVGMPLNGYWMGRLFDRHARFQIHREGDFTAFDSTVEGPVKELIRSIRKRGFTAHQDYKGICELIDVMYDQIDKQFLGHTSTGEVYKKGSGLTTGHSSTSMDNSLALVIFYVAAWKSLTGLSAREFLHFNELSCYGDDHVLSSLATAPRSWTSANITRVMSKWGVINNVFDKKLSDVTFLQKHNSGVTPALARELATAGLSGVTRCIWHDKDRLVGKLTAKLKSTQPTYRATRLFSYLQLTAHHKEIYDAIAKELGNPVLQKIVKNNFGGVPSYNDVLRKWYAATDSTEAPAAEDPEDAWVNDGRLVTVGTPSLLDHVLQALSIIPDLLNPTLFNYGPTRALIGLLSGHLSWVPTLLREFNGVSTFANLDATLRRTPYAWADPDIVLPQRFPDNATTLLVRHWLFMLYMHLRPAIRGAQIAQWAISKCASAAFLLRAEVITDIPRDFFPFDYIFVCAVLDWVRVPLDFLSGIKHVPIPDVAALIDLVVNRVLSFVWTSVPANFSEVDALLGKLVRGQSLLVEAPTGSGKSTAMVAHLFLSQVCSHRKLVVIEPRTMLALGLSNYVSEAFGLFTTAATTGSVFNPAASVWFMTPQSFLGHLDKVDFKHSLFVIDECHLQEPLMVLLLELLPRWGTRVIFTSATPSQSNRAAATYSVDIPISQVYSSRVRSETIDSDAKYLHEALVRVNALPKTSKALVIVDTPEQVDYCVSKSHHPAQGLSSKHSPVLQDVPRYFATNVVDVGVTVPGLELLVSPNWVYGGRGVKYALTDAIAKQRKGRVGRTNNGVMLILEAPAAPLEHQPTPTLEDAWSEALSAGISPALGWRVHPDSMAKLFGLADLTDTEKRDFSRVSHIFLSNFRAMKSLELEQALIEHVSGAPAVLVPTGSLGHFSGSIPQDLAGASRDAFTLLKMLLATIKAGDSAFGLLKEKLANIRTGPLYRVANVILGLVNDPADWVPSVQGSASSAEQVDFDKEIKQINKLLDEIERA